MVDCVGGSDMDVEQGKEQTEACETRVSGIGLCIHGLMKILKINIFTVKIPMIML